MYSVQKRRKQKRKKEEPDTIKQTKINAQQPQWLRNIFGEQPQQLRKKYIHVCSNLIGLEKYTCTFVTTSTA